MNMAHVLTLPDVGRVYLPAPVVAIKSFRDHTRGIPELGIYVAVQHRPKFRDDGRLLGMEMLWASITHNERVDAGAQQQALQTFGGGGTPGSPSTSLYPKVIAVANATLTKGKGDQSLGTATPSVTTNEFTTLGLSRAAAQALVGGDYTAPSSLGGTFQQVLKKTFTATGNATAKGAGVFDSVTVSGSILYGEDNFSSDAILVNNDTLTVTVTVTN